MKCSSKAMLYWSMAIHDKTMSILQVRQTATPRTMDIKGVCGPGVKAWRLDSAINIRYGLLLYIIICWLVQPNTHLVVDGLHKLLSNSISMLCWLTSIALDKILSRRQYCQTATGPMVSLMHKISCRNHRTPTHTLIEHVEHDAFCTTHCSFAGGQRIPDLSIK